MPYDPQRQQRRSIRLRGYDYTQAGAYFVTICTHARRSLFDDQRRRDIAERQWRALAHMDRVALDAWVIMPDHVHGIILITDGAHPPPITPATRPAVPDNAGNAAPLPCNVVPGSLGAIVRTYKSVVTRQINRLQGTPGELVWQRGYWERIVRHAEELNAIRQYIADNPRRRDEDRDNLEALLQRMTMISS
jgi:REP element-mobilizing transposase RayT